MGRPPEPGEAPLPLSRRPDFHLFQGLVRPSLRTLAGPAGEATVEPRVMQVLLALADANGAVVSREDLLQICWGGRIVGDDAINRAIGEVRRIASVTGAGFQIETIPRVGYRLGEGPAQMGTSSRDAPSERVARQVLSRRTLIGSAAAAAALGVAAVWLTRRDEETARFDDLIRRGGEALREDDAEAVRYFEQAAAIQPDNATAWGLLAYAISRGVSEAPGDDMGLIARSAQRAARAALKIDPQEPNALLAMTNVQSDMLDWLSRERQYRRVLAISPDHTAAMHSLAQLLHAVGRCGESLAVTERAVAIEPLWPLLQSRKALRLWVIGRVAEADRVIERAMELWPSHRLVRLARLMIYAFTGRERAALAMVEDEEISSRLLSSGAASVWRMGLVAIENPTTSNIASAREAAVEGSKATPAVAAFSILMLSAVGELDSAFGVANGLLLGRGSVIVRPQPEACVQFVNSWSWRNTFGLFTPPTKAMRLDPRFRPLVDGLGLSAYWRKRGTGPDAFLFQS